MFEELSFNSCHHASRKLHIEPSLIFHDQDDHVSEWWDEGDPQAAENVRVSGQGEAEEEEEEEFVLSPAEQELAAQMAAMGLPTLLGGRIKNQVGLAVTKVDLRF